MNLIPRFDGKKNDPHGIKPVLANIYNKTLAPLLQSWMESESPHKNKIYIGSHYLDCAGKIQEDRYWDKRKDKYDGIHMFGVSGRKEYTRSVLQILRRANIIKHTETQHGMVNTATNTETDEHTDCPQARYQKRTYADAVNGNRYSVPTNNRFNLLNC